jgi:hypothetical protein
MLPNPRGERPEADEPQRQRNEGEGNKTAAREFNRAQTKFAKSGSVDKAAKDAKQAVEGDEKGELSEAEAKGRSKARQ